jgi:hypothetical protein
LLLTRLSDAHRHLTSRLDVFELRLSDVTQEQEAALLHH